MAQALRAVTANLELIARLSGQIGGDSTTVNIALIQQAKADEDEMVRLRRLSLEEREVLRTLLHKMEGDDPDVVDVESAPAVALPAGNGE